MLQFPMNDQDLVDADAGKIDVHAYVRVHAQAYAHAHADVSGVKGNP